MEQKDFEKIVGTTSPTLRAAMKRNPELARAIKVAEIGDESEIDARAEWYIGALPSKKGTTILENGFGVHLDKRCAREMWRARMSYWFTRCQMLRFPYSDKDRMPARCVIELGIEFFTRARKAQLVEFLILHPDITPTRFSSKWYGFESELDEIFRYLSGVGRWLDYMLHCSSTSSITNRPQPYFIKRNRYLSFFRFDPVGAFIKHRIDPFLDKKIYREK